MELINVLRPVVAVGRYVIFAALALHEHPECLRKLRTGDDDYLELFVQEVRRFYPSSPLSEAGRGNGSTGEAVTLPRVRGCSWTFTEPTAIPGYGRSRTRSGRSGFATGTGAPSTSSPGRRRP